MGLKGDDIAERLLRFAADAINAATQMTSHPARQHIRRQLMRSGTSGGANYEEARCSESRNDFAHKVLIAAKEVREAMYWIRLSLRIGIGPATAAGVIEEGRQIAAILVKSARTARDNASARR